MQKVIQNYLERFQQDKQRRRRLVSVFLVLALAVAVGVTWSLKMDGIAVTNTAYCGEEEHTHSDACYTTELVCGMEEGEGHTHSDSCYETNSALSCEKEEHTHSDGCYTTERVLTCGQEEGEDHQHSDDCYTEEKTLTCGKEEHTHSGSCYTEEKTLVCGKEESDGHTHSDSCYESVLSCGKEEHTHSTDCYSDEGADTETASDWEKTLPSLSDSMNEDVARVAESQLGYTESTANFVLADDGETRRGYTRYGAWYGNEYGDWDAMFASFCLYYAGCTKDIVPYASGSYSWVTELKDADLYQTAAEAEPAVGDIVFFDENGDGKADACGIVTGVTESKITAVRGDYEQDGADKVVSKSYSLSDGDILGYGVLPQDEDGETDPADGDEQLMTAAEDDLEAAAESSSTTTTSSDLTEYVTDITLKKSQNNKWTVSNEYTEGDEIQVTMNCSFPSGTVTTSNKTFTYTLPTGMTVDKDMSGYVSFGSSSYVGTYKIDAKTGLITITFYDSFADGRQMTGYLQFEGSVALTGNGSSSKLSFPTQGGGSQDITVKEDTTAAGLKTKKTGSITTTTSDGKTIISYEVTVTNTSRATSEDITITDTLGSSVATYDKDSIVIKDSDGKTVTGWTPDVTTDSSTGNQTCTITRLAGLEYNESYTITYNVTVNTNGNGTDGAISVGNTVKPNEEPSAYKDVSVRSSVISKSGSYDPDTGLITWTISIHPQGTDLDGYTLSDNMLTDGSNVTITVKDSNGDTVSGDTSSYINSTYTLGSNAKNAQEITITYTTSATDEQAAAKQAKNEAKLEKGTDSYVGKATVPVTTREDGMESKTGTDTGAYNNGSDRRSLSWTSKVTLSSGTKLARMGTLVYTDTILNNTTSAEDDSNHYTTLKAVNDALAASGAVELTYVEADGTNKTADASSYLTWTVVGYTQSGTAVTDTTDDTTKITKFKVTFTAESGIDGTITGKYITFTYPTIGVVDKTIVDKKQYWKNQGEVNGDVVDATAYYTRKPQFNKTASSTGWENEADYKNQEGNNIYYWGNKLFQPSDTVTVNSDGSGYIYYRILVKPSDGNGVTVTDTLPSGATYVNGSGFVRYAQFDTNGTIKDTQATSTIQKGLSLDGVGTFTVTTDGKLTVNIPAGTYACWPEGDAMHDTWCLAIYYAVELDDANKATKADVTLTNTAEWDGNTATAETTVSKENIVVKKTGTQLTTTDQDGNTVPGNEVSYSVTLNSNGADLDSNSDTLTLTDTLTYKNLDSVRLESSSVKLYYYDSTKTDNKGSLVDSSRYTVNTSTDGNDELLEITIPDEVGFVLEYTYEFDASGYSEDWDIDNEAALAGETSTVDSIQIETNKSSAGVAKDLTIYKVDSQDRTKSLDAEFKLAEWKDNSWDTKPETLSTKGTTASGRLQFILPASSSSMKEDAVLTANTLYMLTETNSLTAGYTTSNTPMYFVWLGSGMTESDWLSANSTLPEGVSADSIEFINYTGGELDFTNESNSISVTKAWVDSSGVDTTDHPSSATVQLYRSTGKDSSYTVTVEDGYIDSTTGEFTFNSYINKRTTLSVKPNTKLTITAKNLWGWSDMTITVKNGTSVTQNAGESSTVTWSTTVTGDMTIQMAGAGVSVNNCSFSYTAGGMVADENTKTALGDPVTLNSDNNWTYTWTSDNTTGFAQNDSNGNPYYYTVEEVNVPSGYTVSYMNNDGIQTGTITITNRKNETPKSDTTSITVNKVWKDANGDDAASPTTISSITFDLYQVTDGAQPGTKIGDTYTISKDDGWTYTVDNLPTKRTDKNGTEHTYTYYVVETAVENYDTSYSTESVTNTENPAATAVNSDTITITNRLSSKSYTLPKSGGIGTGPLTAGGLLLCAGALLLARTRRRRGEAR